MSVINPAIKKIIENILSVEGGYVDDKSDNGSETNLGITIATARRNGFTGSMRELTKEQATDIYFKEYVSKVNFDKVVESSEKVGAKIIDAGVNVGCGQAGKFLQQALNTLGDFKLSVDGVVGTGTLTAMSAFISGSAQREAALLKAFNCIQGYFYLGLVDANPSQRKFIVGWLNNRVSL